MLAEQEQRQKSKAKQKVAPLAVNFRRRIHGGSTILAMERWNGLMDYFVTFDVVDAPMGEPASIS